MKNTPHWQPILAMTAAGLIILWIAAILWLYQYDHNAYDIAPIDMPTADAALVLGNAVYKNGEPNPCLSARVVSGAELYLNHKVPLLIMSGGTDVDGRNQAEAMRDMALALGVPAKDIVLETRSENTFENIRHSTLLTASAQSVVLVSSGFHLPRARMIAHQQWPGKHILTFGGHACVEPSSQLLWKLNRELLAIGKTFAWDMAARP